MCYLLLGWPLSLSLLTNTATVTGIVCIVSLLTLLIFLRNEANLVGGNASTSDARNSSHEHTDGNTMALAAAGKAMWETFVTRRYVLPHSLLSAHA